MRFKCFAAQRLYKEPKPNLSTRPPDRAPSENRQRTSPLSNAHRGQKCLPIAGTATIGPAIRGIAVMPRCTCYVLIYEGRVMKKEAARRSACIDERNEFNRPSPSGTEITKSFNQ